MNPNLPMLLIAGHEVSKQSDTKSRELMRKSACGGRGAVAMRDPAAVAQSERCVILACLVAVALSLAAPAQVQGQPATAPTPNAAAPATTAPGAGKQGNAVPAPVVKSSGGLLSISAKDVDVRALIAQVAAESGVEIVLDKSIAGQVTADFKELGFEEALKRLLRDIVAGGVSSEFIKKSNASGEFDLRKVVIAPKRPETATDPSRVLRIDKITVQDAVGKEVVFAKRGHGPGEIPLEGNVTGTPYRAGFRRLRVSEDGTIYLFGGAMFKAFLFDGDGKPKGALSFPSGYGYNEIDHEGNIYLMGDAFAGPPIPVRVLRPDGKEIASITVPPTKTYSSWPLEIDDGLLKDRKEGAVYDFRKYLKNPNGHATRRRYFGRLDASWPSPEIFVHGVAELGIDREVIKTPVPDGWEIGRSGLNVLGADRQQRIYVLISLNRQWQEGERPVPFYDDFGVAVLDPHRGVTDYFKINERDTFVYEYGDMMGENNRFDMDLEGNVYHVFTTKEGTHVYKYALGGGRP